MDKLDVEERQKIASLQREKKDAASGIGWMYKGEKPESEEYLLGKRIDKHVEGEEDKKEDEASVIFGERIKANIALDVAAKMREDPLFAIRRKEDESRKKLLENPIRMKELQKLISQQEKEKEKKEKKSKKHKKKDKKKKKKKRKGGGESSDSNSEEDSNEEGDIMAKYLSILTSKHGEREESSDRDRKKNLKGDERREPRDGRQRDQRPEGFRQGGHHRESNGETGRNDRGIREQNRQGKFESKRWRGGDERRNIDNRERRGSSREQGNRDFREERYERGSPDIDRPRDTYKNRDRQRDRGSDNEDRRMKDRGKHRDDSETGRRGRGKEDKQKHPHSRRGERSPSSENSDGKERREESSRKEKHKRDKGSRSKREETKRKRSSSSSSSSSSDASSTGSRERPQDSQQPKQYGLIMSKSAEEAAKARRRSRSLSSSPSRHKKQKTAQEVWKPVRRQPSPPRRKLTDEEKQRKLEEMMKNAEWREDQREINVKKYREEDKERERKDNEKQSSGFISSLMVEHAASSSVEDRIRRNKYNIQRTRKDLDKNFTQK